ncbi:MAG: prolipoprotein diacylglyceryl transferase [Clostridia bacterium]|nr:prolipoprotein diacylglyceryl transferase [Clostridia bacterium]
MTAFTIPFLNIEVKWYAIMIVIGMVAALLSAGLLFKRRGMTSDTVIDFAILVLPLGILGARFYYIIFSSHSAWFWALFKFWEGIHWLGIIVGLIGGFALACLAVKLNPLRVLRILPAKEGQKNAPEGAKDFVIMLVVGLATLLFGAHLFWLIFNDPDESLYNLFNLRMGGLAIYGGVIMGVVALLIVCRVKRFTFRQVLQVLDCAAVAVIIGQAIGRWGNFFNQEAYGQRITDAAWQWFPFAVKISAANSVDGAAGWFHATFFYESMLNIFGFFVLLYMGYKNKNKPGINMCGYFVWYGTVRAFIEGLRTDSLFTAGGTGTFRVSQLLSMGLIAFGVITGFIISFKDCNQRQRLLGYVLSATIALCALVWTVGQLFENALTVAGVLSVGYLVAGVALVAFSYLTPSRISRFAGAATLTVGVLYLCLAGAPVWCLAFLAVPAVVLVLALTFKGECVPCALTDTSYEEVACKE